MTIPDNTQNRIELWLDLINQIRPQAFVEIGVWKGEFAEAVLKQCPSITRYRMIDPWAQLPDWNKPFNVSSKEFGDVFDEAMDRTRFASDRIEVLRGRTKEVADRIEDGSVDFVYVDGDHTLRGITIDLIKIFPKVREGGFVAGDDFVNFRQHSGEYEPTLVCPFAVYFAEAMNVPILGLPHNQFLILKNQEGFRFDDQTGGYGNLSLNKMIVRETCSRPGIYGRLKRVLARTSNV
jgi:hypothetical protein